MSLMQLDGDLDIKDRFRQLEATYRATLLENVNRRVRTETELGHIFAHINDVVPVDVVMKADLLKLAREDQFAAFVSDGMDDNPLEVGTVASYCEPIDTIILHDYQGADITGLLTEGMTFDGVLAHERLHAIQHRVGGFIPILRYLIAQGHTQHGAYHIPNALEPVLAAMIPGVRSGAALEYFQRAMGTGHIAYELAARTLTPRFADGQLQLVSSEWLELDKLGLKIAHRDFASRFVIGVVGKCVAEAFGEIDINVSLIVGEHGRDIEKMHRAMPQVERFMECGMDYLRGRHKQVLYAIDVARDELKKNLQ